MKRSIRPALASVVLLSAVGFVGVPVRAEDPVVEPAASGLVVFTSVARLPEESRTTTGLDQPTEESNACVERHQDRLMTGRQHPWRDPIPFSSGIDEDLAMPLNDPTTAGVELRGIDPIEIFANTEPSAVASTSYRSTVHEPAVAASHGRVFYSANWYAATSTDLGQTFSFVNPFPGPYANPPGESFCCDQTVTHDPSTNTLFWLQQFIPNTSTSSTTGTQRINVDRNADGTWDCAYDITTLTAGFNPYTWFDFPDMVVSDNYLWHSSNVFTSTGSWAGTYAGRYPLVELAACTQNLTIDAYTDTNYFSFRFARGATDTMYFAAHHSQTALRVFTWPDSSALPTAASAAVALWPNQTRSCPGPDDREWCARQDSRIQSGFVSGNVLGFLWVPSQNANFPFPYTRISTFDLSAGLARIADIDIWSPDVAYVYPSAAVNRDGALGGTIMWGGGTVHYPSCSAWMADTPTAGALVPLEHQLSIAGTIGPLNGEGRSGDYLTTATYHPNDRQFVGACFAYFATSRGTARFVHFGRSSSSTDIFADGFESGDVGAWSTSVP